MANCQLSDLLRAGLLKVTQVAEVTFQNKKWSGEVTEDDGGSLCFSFADKNGEHQQKCFKTPGQAALACVKTVNPKQCFVNGWTVSTRNRNM